MSGIQLHALEPFLPAERLDELLAPMKIFLSEDILHVLPSTALGADGPTLSSFFCITEHFIVEHRVIPGKDNFEFDVTSLGSLENYRVRAWMHEQSGAEAVSPSYQMGLVKLIHFGEFMSQISYCGFDRMKWLSAVEAALPLSLVLKR
jgi:hypothetical protein